MNNQIIYFSRKGSTKKVADAIASELNEGAEDVKTAVLKKEATLFLGSGCYAGKPGKLMIQFLENNDFNGKNVALFGTSGGGIGKEVNEMEKYLLEKNAKILGKFYCKGKFAIMNRGRPDAQDLNKAKEFAQKMIKG